VQYKEVPIVNEGRTGTFAQMKPVPNPASCARCCPRETGFPITHADAIRTNHDRWIHRSLFLTPVFPSPPPPFPLNPFSRLLCIRTHTWYSVLPPRLRSQNCPLDRHYRSFCSNFSEGKRSSTKYNLIGRTLRMPSGRGTLVKDIRVPPPPPPLTHPRRNHGRRYAGRV
jgi:hypothetical protein